MTVSDYVAAFLAAQGVPAVFQVAGGMIAHLLDSMFRQGAVRLISVHHEQAAAMAADAVGRITGIPGVALATSGPGATNLLTASEAATSIRPPPCLSRGRSTATNAKGHDSCGNWGFRRPISWRWPVL